MITHSSERNIDKFGLPVRVFESRRELGEAAAATAAALIQKAIRARGSARILVATGNSQIDMMNSLARRQDVEWNKVDAFHLDEYVGLSADHPASFRRWIRSRFEQVARPRSMHYIQGDAKDLKTALTEYGDALTSQPIDLAFVGFGENGHIAFNDPHVANFSDPHVIKTVTLDEACRRQQVGEGHFPSLDSVPREAATVTCSTLLRAEHWICCVPEARKAVAVKGALEGAISTDCPASVVRRHKSAFVFLDTESAALLS